MDTAMKCSISFVSMDSRSSVMGLQVQLSRYTHELALNRQGISS
jgi:hypothetical protein